MNFVTYTRRKRHERLRRFLAIGGLVFLVLILSLRPKVALWVTVGIGVAFLGTFALLPSNDVSLNIMSTFAFLLVLVFRSYQELGTDDTDEMRDAEPRDEPAPPLGY